MSCDEVQGENIVHLGDHIEPIVKLTITYDSKGRCTFDYHQASDDGPLAQVLLLMATWDEQRKEARRLGAERLNDERRCLGEPEYDYSYYIETGRRPPAKKHRGGRTSDVVALPASA